MDSKKEIEVEAQVTREGTKFNYKGTPEGVSEFIYGVSNLQLTLPKTKEIIQTETTGQTAQKQIDYSMLRSDNQLKAVFTVAGLLALVATLILVGGRK